MPIVHTLANAKQLMLLSRLAFVVVVGLAFAPALNTAQAPRQRISITALA